MKWYNHFRKQFNEVEGKDISIQSSIYDVNSNFPCRITLKQQFKCSSSGEKMNTVWFHYSIGGIKV